MKPFKKAFGTCRLVPDEAGKLVEKCAVTALQQSLVSVTFLFAAVGGALSGLTGKFLGRRGTIQVGCLLVAVGAGGMLGTAGNFTHYMVCKCIGGVGIGHMISAAPVYGVESLAAHNRGAMLSIYGIGLAWGNSVAAAVCLGSSRYGNNLSWQIPIICQIPLSLVLGAGILMFPESPRWLMVKGREEEARKAFARFYSKDPSHPQIQRQLQDVQDHLETERSLRTTMHWTEIFHSGQLKRTLTSALCLVSLAICGGKFVVPYAAIFLAGVGVSNPFLINFIVSACIAGASLVSPFVNDLFGRRINMLVGFGLQAVFMLIIGAVGSGLGAKSEHAKLVLVVFLCLWGALYGSIVGASCWTSSPELHTIRLRTYGQAFSTMCYEIFGFAASFYSPYMVNKSYGNMGLNVGYFYFGVTAVVWIMLYCLVPETSRLTLEGIDDHFLSGRKAWNTSISRNKKIAAGQLED